tara:strand:+ start:14076 stop:14579 length:504 start_codon:yes stop_codon:yes gene_type:complete
MSEDNKPKRGRPRKYHTEAEAIAASKAYQKEYLNKRRERYAKDPAYREKIINAERLRYKKTNPSFRPKSFGADAGNASQYAKVNPKYLTIDEIAKFIGVVPKVLSIWITTGKFPEPTNILSTGQKCYTLDQANAVAFVLKEDLEGRAAFRTTDTYTIERVWDSIENN